MANTVDNCLKATYYIETPGDLRKVAAFMVELETTGKWQGDGPPTTLFQQAGGEVLAVRETAPGRGEVDLLFPLVNMNLDEAAFANLWLTMVGGGTHALTMYAKSRLVDFWLPADAYRHFPGPQFGIKGTRAILGIGDDELIIGTIVKPTAGLTAEEVADICYQAALGGVRFIKDDEKMLNPPYCPLGKRVKLVTQALKRAQEQTGQKVLYTPHITAGPDRIRANALIALENGAEGLMLNFFAAGFAALEILARDPDINVPLYGHCGGKEALGREPGQGVDPVVVDKFARLCGADYMRISTLGGYMVGGTPAEGKALAHAMREPLGHIKDAVPAVSGGLNPTNMVENLQVFGLDIMALAGTGITGHPDGIKAGVTALRQAAEAFRLHIPIADYAKEHRALSVALEHFTP